MKDSSIMQNSIIAADVRMKAGFSREERGEARIPSKTQKRFFDIGGELKHLRVIDS